MEIANRALVDPRAFDIGSQPTSGGHDLLRVLRRHSRLLLTTMAVVMGAAILALIFIQPRYDATAVMLVDLDELQLLGPQPTAASVRDAELLRQHRIATQLQLLGSRPLARRTVRDLGLHDDREFNPSADPDKTPDGAGPFQWLAGFGDRLGITDAGPVEPKAIGPSPQLIERTTDRLLAALTVKQDQQSSFINVTVRSLSAAKAARIANKITSNYVNTQVAQRNASRARNAAALRTRIGQLREELAATEWGIASYRRAHQIDPELGAVTNGAQMGRLASELVAARSARAETEMRAAGSGQVTSPLMVDLASQETALERRLAELSTLYGSAHPDVLKAQAEMTQVQGAAQAERARVRLQLANEASAQRARESLMAGDLGAMRSASLQRGMASVPLADNERKAEAMRSMYLTLLGRLQEVGQGTGQAKPDASIASSALVPTAPSFPRRGQVLGAAGAGALIFGFVLVLMAEALDRQVRTASAVFALTGLGTFGMIPEQLRRRRGWLPHRTVVQDPYSLFAESVRMTYGRLARLLPNPTGNVVLITSPLPGDGKTTMAASIAAAALASGRTAVIVDLDLRHPGLPDFVAPADGEKTLQDFLDGNAMLDDILVSSGAVEALKAIPVGVAAPDPGASLASPRLQLLIDRLRARFDFVVLNAPPVLAVGDAQALADRCDAVLLVLRWGKTTQDVLRSAIAQLDVAPVGVVFNRVRFERHARMSYGDRLQYYREYASYHRKPRRLMPRLIGGRVSSGA